MSTDPGVILLIIMPETSNTQNAIPPPKNFHARIFEENQKIEYKLSLSCEKDLVLVKIDFIRSLTLKDQQALNQIIDIIFSIYTTELQPYIEATIKEGKVDLKTIINFSQPVSFNNANYATRKCSFKKQVNCKALLINAVPVNCFEPDTTLSQLPTTSQMVIPSSLEQLIRAQNKLDKKQENHLLAEIPVTLLRNLIDDHSKFNNFINSTSLSPETFDFLLNKLEINYIKEIINIKSKEFSWWFFLNNVPANLRSTLVINRNELTKEIRKCLDLGHVLAALDNNDHEQLYTNIKLHLPKIVGSYFDLRDINEKFYPVLFQKLGYPYLVSLVLREDCGYYLLKALYPIPKIDRFLFLELIGLDKLRAYLNKEEYIDELLNLMPPETQQKLKSILFLFEADTQFTGSQPRLIKNANKNILDLNFSKTSCQQIIKPFNLDDEHIVGIGSSNSCPSLLIYNKRFDKIAWQYDSYNDVRILDPNEGSIIAHRWKSNQFDKFIWKNKALHKIATAFSPIHSAFQAEQCQDMIQLDHVNWMILNKEEHGVGNDYVGWSIDLLNTDTFTIKRVFNAHKDHFTCINRLTLLPDGETVLGWSSVTTVIPKAQSFCSMQYKICLINVQHFAVQLIVLPISANRFPGSISQVNTQNNEIEIEITGHTDSLNSIINKAEKYYFSLEFRPLATKNSSENLKEAGVSPRFFYKSNAKSPSNAELPQEYSPAQETKFT